MARKKRTIIEEDADEKELELGEEIDLGGDEEKKREWLKDFQSRFTDQDVKILIEKREETGDWAICRKYSLETFDMEPVKEEWGPGRYRGTLYDEHGHYIKQGRVQFRFANAVKKDQPIIIPKPENPLENPIVALMLKSMEQNQANLLTMMQTFMAAQGAIAPKATGLGELLEGVKALRGMMPTEGKSLDSVKDMLSIWKMFKDVTGKEGEGREGLLGDVREFLELLPTLKESLPVLKAALPVPPGQTPVPTQPNPGDSQMDSLTKAFTEHVPEFVDAAKQQAPVTEWGTYLLDLFEETFLPLLVPVLTKKYAPFIRTEEDVYDAVVKAAQDANEREKIFKAVPPLHEHRAWVLKVIEEAVRLSEIDPEEMPIPATSGGGSSILTTVETNGAKKEG